jgi:UrcA family protein
MIKRSLALTSKYAAFAALGLLAGSLAPMHHAIAQSSFTQSDEQITVGTPRTVHRQFVGRSASGVPIEELSLTRHISYADLNLNNPADRNELARRITFAVNRACTQLDNLYPDSVFPPVYDHDCRAQASNEGMAQMRAVLVSSR